MKDRTIKEISTRQNKKIKENYILKKKDYIKHQNIGALIYKSGDYKAN